MGVYKWMSEWCRPNAVANKQFIAELWPFVTSKYPFYIGLFSVRSNRLELLDQISLKPDTNVHHDQTGVSYARYKVKVTHRGQWLKNGMKCRVQAISLPCIKGFGNYLVQMFTIVSRCLGRKTTFIGQKLGWNVASEP